MVTKNQKPLLELLKSVLFKTEPVFQGQVDWNGVFREAKVHAIICLTAPGVPEEERIKWRMEENLQKANFIRLIQAQSELIDLFEEHHIPVVILKGTAAAQYYPAPFRRTMGDVDFYVSREQLEEAQAILQENGYSQIHEDDGRHIAYRKQGLIFEMHYRFSSPDCDIEPIILDGFSHASYHRISNKIFPSLPDAENGIVLLAHIRHHIMLSGIGLRQIIDWMMFVHAYLTPEKWDNEFKPLADQTGFTSFSKVLTLMCKMYIGLPDPVPWCENADQSAASELMEFVLNSGNFGQKDRKVAEQRQVEVVSRNVRSKGLFRYLQETGEVRWSLLERHPHLKPFAWMYQTGRILKAGMKSGLKLGDIRNNLTSGDKKGQLIKKLGLN